MGRKKHRHLRKIREDGMFDKSTDRDDGSGSGPSSYHQSAKQLSKKNKKQKKSMKKHQVAITKEHHWYKVSS